MSLACNAVRLMVRKIFVAWVDLIPEMSTRFVSSVLECDVRPAKKGRKGFYCRFKCILFEFAIANRQQEKVQFLDQQQRSSSTCTISVLVLGSSLN